MRKYKNNQRGFTLPELMIVIVLLGILAAIAIPSWFGLVENRRVESAANQLAADLRLAHSRTSNQVGTDWVVSLHPNRGSQDSGPDYSLNGENRTFPGNVEISDPTSEVSLTFESDGTVESSGATVISVSGRSGSPRTITITTTTSNVEVSP